QSSLCDCGRRWRGWQLELYCTVLLCLAGCWSSTEAAPGLNYTEAKPGVCPRINSDIRCIMKDAELCDDDSECPKNQKCCGTACGGTLCTAPITAKPGVCPQTIAELVRCSEKDLELCVGDSECPKNQKCCGTACGGTRCTAPVTEKPGVCPRTNSDIRCIIKDAELCDDDSECPKNQKCCGTACGGTRCTAPITAKPGVCPKKNAELVWCSEKDLELCVGDSECPKNQKCCGTACGGTRCTAPVTVKPGVCPSKKYEPAECTWIKFKSCADDSDCANNQKCCSNGCGRQCMDPVTDVCRLPMESGMCLAYIPVWGFDSSARKCVSFIYGGCQGNGNRFDSPEECEESCVRSAACSLPMEVGPCKAAMPRWGFDPAAGKCVSFMYGGCEGNDNRFNSEEECEESCGVRNAACSLPMEVGPCKAAMPRWGFDPAAGKCVSFMYGGCEGNDNRFNSEEECEESCGVRNVNPGVCPRRKYELAMCARVTFMPCVDDSDCAKNEKCCNNGCGLQCMAAVTAKPGVCPIKKYKPAMCARIRFVSCADDSDCTNNQKCCNNGCGLQCMDPVKVKPGVCPVRKPKPWMCPLMNFMSCVDDADCVNNEKCCSNGCGFDCMAPVTGRVPMTVSVPAMRNAAALDVVWRGWQLDSTEAAPGLNLTVNPGVCPSRTIDPGMCVLIRFVSCADDSECTNNQKCCSNGCGFQCMDPVTVKPGVCPKTNSDIRCIRKDDELCADDSECPDNQKCCRTACGGTRCTAPVTVKPGVCPKTNSEIRCIRKDYELCADDSECPDNQKCCGTPCGGTRCMAPVTVNPGVCPGTRYGPEECTWIKFVSCADDSDCAKNQKCCNNGCGLQCMAAVTDVCRLPMDPGPCEAYMPMWGFDSAAGKCVSFIYGGCQGNGNRFNSQKECEKSCMRSVNPGVCPRRKYEAAMCPRVTFESCVDDSDCAKNEKCCSNRCGRQCMAAVTAKPGLCPIKKYKPPMCARIRFVSCADDRDCANNQKCCNNGCGLQCMDPVKVKPGVCPVRKPKLGMCPLMNFMSCADDSDCVDNEKCCNNGCGLDCMPPVTGPLPN
ncbi:tissue factor pathway inhibitor, partial [Pimephales promelas]